MTNQLQIGDIVERDDGLRGEVSRAGPYGDQPFQIKDEHGKYHPFINEDGTSPYNEWNWQQITIG